MKAFMEPEMVIEKFMIEDIITTSLGGGIEGDASTGGGDEE